MSVTEPVVQPRYGKDYMKDSDVYAYGVIAASELHLLRTPFPSPDGYAEIHLEPASCMGDCRNGVIDGSGNK